MIFINHEKKAIFIHIPKTGGSYIGPQLIKHYGFKSYLPLLHKKRPDHDTICETNRFKKVLTQIHKYDNTFLNKLIGILMYFKTSEYMNKIANMDEEKWKTYTKFCFVRNPYDRSLSGWAHIQNIYTGCLPFVPYICQDKYNVTDVEYGHIFMSQKTQIQDIDGTCGVDIIGRFENLENDFRKILNMIGFDKIVHNPKKVNVSKIHDSDNIALNVVAIKKLNELFEDDFNTFHYKKINL
jgi:hypothetical protein